MAERPEPVDDLNWDSARARGFGERVLDLWEEFLAKLPDLSVTSRDFTAGWDVRRQGVTAGSPLRIYASEQVHVVTDRGADMLGLGTDAVRKIPVDGDYRMRLDVLEEEIERDVASGVKPIAVVGT